MPRLFTFRIPKNINFIKNLPCRNTWKYGNFMLLPVMCSQCQIWVSLSVHLVYRAEDHTELPDVIWHHRQQGNGCKLLTEWLNGVNQITWCKTFLFNKVRSRFHLANLRRARCSPSVFIKMLTGRKTYLITARAHKNKRTARKCSQRPAKTIRYLYSPPINFRAISLVTLRW